MWARLDVLLALLSQVHYPFVRRIWGTRFVLCLAV